MTATVTATKTRKTVKRVNKTADVAVKAKRTPSATTVRTGRTQLAIGGIFAAGALTMTGLSLSHLASGFALATHRPMVEGWIMASATDIGFIAAEVLPFAATAAALTDLRFARIGLTCSVVAASAYFNYLSMGPWGLAVPALMATFAHFASRLLLGRAK